jgi:hypothetical protein
MSPLQVIHSAADATDAGTPLPADTFRTVVASTPLVSIDLLVCDARGRYLVGRRLNPPAQGSWFVPGGRIRKNERLAVALCGLQRDELGTEVALGDPAFAGVYEHFYEDTLPAKRAARPTMWCWRTGSPCTARRRACRCPSMAGIDG